MEFIEKSNELNDVGKYPQLMQRCKHIGYEVSNVVFRGYYASPTLQDMHDSTITARNRLKIAVRHLLNPLDSNHVLTEPTT